MAFGDGQKPDKLRYYEETEEVSITHQRSAGNVRLMAAVITPPCSSEIQVKRVLISLVCILACIFEKNFPDTTVLRLVTGADKVIHWFF